MIINDRLLKYYLSSGIRFKLSRYDRSSCKYILENGDTTLIAPYKLKVYAPLWLDLSDILEKFFDSEIDSIEKEEDHRKYTITYTVESKTTCSEEDKFDFLKGIHICECKAEENALMRLSKFMRSLESIINLDMGRYNSDVISKRLKKNRDHIKTLSEE